ncbi:hypothetical protein IFO70_01235 [Phormidium tenue FACHB-886]|nr:hypothetical protein [Phormidium tenue FACHB-886]
MKQNCSSVGLDISISRSDRWQAYYRLQELDISCTCLPNGGFRANIDTPTAAAQLWSVTQHLMAPRQQLAEWLLHCWKLSC